MPSYIVSTSFSFQRSNDHLDFVNYTLKDVVLKNFSFAYEEINNINFLRLTFEAVAHKIMAYANEPGSK